MAPEAASPDQPPSAVNRSEIAVLDAWGGVPQAAKVDAETAQPGVAAERWAGQAQAVPELAAQDRPEPLKMPAVPVAGAPCRPAGARSGEQSYAGPWAAVA